MSIHVSLCLIVCQFIFWSVCQSDLVYIIFDLDVTIRFTTLPPLIWLGSLAIFQPPTSHCPHTLPRYAHLFSFIPAISIPTNKNVVHIWGGWLMWSVLLHTNQTVTLPKYERHFSTHLVFWSIYYRSLHNIVSQITTKHVFHIQSRFIVWSVFLHTNQTVPSEMCNASTKRRATLLF